MFMYELCRSGPGAVDALAAESSATEETASDASYSADDQPDRQGGPAPSSRGPMPSSTHHLVGVVVDVDPALLACHCIASS